MCSMTSVVMLFPQRNETLLGCSDPVNSYVYNKHYTVIGMTRPILWMKQNHCTRDNNTGVQCCRFSKKISFGSTRRVFIFIITKYIERIKVSKKLLIYFEKTSPQVCLDKPDRPGVLFFVQCIADSGL